MADIRLANPNADSEQLAAIYYPYVINTAITFDTVPVKGHSFRDRITKSMTVYPWVVCEHEKEIMGYAHGGNFEIKMRSNGLSKQLFTSRKPHTAWESGSHSTKHL